MENFYSKTVASSIYKKLTQAIALTMMLIMCQIAKAQVPALTYPGSKIFAAGIPISTFAPSNSSDVSALGFTRSDVVSNTPNYPSAMTIDANGNIYFGDSDKIYKVPTGANSGTLIAEGFNYVSCLAVDGNGDLFIGENVTRQITKITNPGQAGSVRSTLVSGIGLPGGIAFDQQNHMFVTEYNGNNDVIRYTLVDGAATNKTVIAYNLSIPKGIAIDKAGNIFIADYGTVYKMAATLTSYPVAASNLQVLASNVVGTDGLALDNGGNIYVTGFDANVLHRIDAVNNNLTDLPGALISPGAVVADITGNIFVITSNGQTIFKYVQNGGYSISGLPAGLIFNANTGEISGTPTAITTPADYTITGYNTSGNSATSIVNMQVLSGNANLSGITLSAGSLAPSFSAGITTYNASVVSSVSSITVTATAVEAGGTVSINGATATTTTASSNIALAEGANIITIVVTAPGSNTKIYNLTVTKQGALSIQYSGPQYYAVGAAVTPLVPSSANVLPFSYNQTSLSVVGGSPTGIAVGKNGNIAVAVGGVVKRIDPAGVVTATITIPSYSAQFVAMDSVGNIYTLNTGSGATFRKISATDNTISTISGGAATPSSLIVDPTGTYLYYSVITSVRRMPIAGGSSFQLTTGYSTIAGMAMNKAGDLFISDATGIYRVSSANAITTAVPKANLGGTYISGYASTNGLAAGNAGELFISDFGAKAVKRVDPSRNITTTSTSFSGPKWLAVNENGDVYVSDNSGTTVQRLAQSGGFYINPILPGGLSFNTTTGAISGTPIISSPSVTYTVTAFGAEGATANNSVAIAIADASLSGITVSDGGLSPAFSATTLNYAVATAKTSINITAATSSAGSSLTINGIAAAAGTPSTVALNLGDNIIPIVVKANDGITTTTYTLTINRFAPPTLAYPAGPYTFAAASAISPITPTGSNVSAFAYGAYNHFYNTISSTAQNVTTDSLGNVYTVSGYIYKIPAGGGDAIAIPGSTAFYNTQAMIADAAGNLYVGGYDVAPTSVSKVTVDGSVTQIATGFSYITGIGRDAIGNIYINDAGTIKKIDATSHIVTNVTNSGTVANSGQIAVDKAGNIYVYGGATTTTYVYKIPATATYPVALAQMTPMGTGLSGVSGVTIDNLGNLFTINQGSPRAILKTTPANVTTTVGTVPNPGIGIAVDPFGNIYTASQGLPLGVLQNKQAGGYYVSPALPDGVIIDQSTGIISGTPTGSSPATNYTVYAYTQADTYAAATVNISTVDASLSALSVSTGNLSPAFSPSTGSYTVSVLPSVVSVTVTPKASAAGATITVNNAGVTSNSASAPITLQDGDNPISIIVTAPDGITTKTYVVNVNRPAAPTINYGLTGTQVYNVNSAITALIPASTNVASYGSNGYPSSTAALSTITSAIPDPWGIAIDQTNNLYVVNVNIARKISGSTVTALTGTYSSPYGVATDAAGNVYVADYGKGLLKNGVSFGSGSGISNILSVAVDRAGNIYMGNYGSSSILKIAAGSTTATTFVTGCPNPFALATDAAGNVYVTNSTSSGSLTRITPAGVKTVLATAQNNPSGVEIDGSGNIYLICIDKVKLIPASVTSFPTTPINMIGNATFAAPGLGDIAIDNANNLYITYDGATTDVVQKLTPNGGFYISPSLPAGLSFDNTTGAISGTPTTTSAPTTYTITGYNSASIPGSTTLTLKTAGSTATLSSLIPGLGTLSPAFSPTVTEYSTIVTGSTISITPTATDPSAVITVNGITTVSGTASADIPLTFDGVNSIPVVVTSGDGSTVKTYTLTVKRIAGLKTLVASAGTLSPVFSSTNFGYTIQVSNSTANIAFTPTEGEAAIAVNGSTVASGSASQPVTLVEGLNTVNIVVTYPSPDSTKTYTILINKLKTQTITFSAYTSSQPTGLPDSMPATSSSGLPITYTSSNSTRATIVGGKIHLQGVGSVVITASQPGNNVYEAATPVQQSITITKGTAIITLAPTDTVVYGTANYSPAVSTNTGTNITYSSNNTAVITTATSNTRLKVVALGTATITASQVGTTNYNVPASKQQTIVVVKAPATAPIIFPALIAAKYNEPDFSPGATSTIPVAITYLSSDTTVAKIIDGKIHVVSPGTTIITASQAPADGFHLSPTPVSQQLTVKAIPILLSGVALSVGQVTKVNNDTYTAIVKGLSNSKLKLTPYAIDSLSTISINGVPVQSGQPSGYVTLNAVGTPTVISISVQDTDGNTQFITLTVNREAFVNADLASIQVSDGVLTKTAETTYQSIITDMAVSRLTVKAVTADTTASIVVNGIPVASGTDSDFITLNATGQTVVNIQVIAESGTTKTYILNVLKLSANADLKELAFSTGTLTKTSDTEYSLVVKGAVISQVLQKAIAADTTATLTVNGSPAISNNEVVITLNPTGTTTVTTVITAASGASKTYTVNITRELSSNAELSQLSFGSGTLTRVDSTTYNLLLSGASTQVIQTVTTADTTATLKVNGQAATSGVDVIIPLNASGITTVTTVVTAESGVTKTYRVNISKPQLSNNANLSRIAYGSSKLTAVSDTVYNLSVASAITQVTQNAVASYPASTLKVNGQAATSGVDVIIPLNANGITTVTTVVTAESGVTKTYRVNISKPQLSNNANLSRIAYGSSKLTTVSDTVYNLSVASAITQVTQNAVASYPASTLKVNGQAATSGVDVIIPLNASGITTVTTVVTAESGVTKTYRVNISKPQLSNNANLSRIAYGSSKLTTVSDTVYNLSVAAAITQVTQNAVASYPASTLKVNGQAATSGVDVIIPLNANGITTVTTVVTAESGVTKTYRVNISKPQLSNNANLSRIAYGSSKLTTVSDTVYNLSVAAAITQVTQNAVASYAASTLKVNGQAATSGVDVIIPLNANGITTVTTVVTAESGVTKTYRVNISKPQLSNNANLSRIAYGSSKLTTVSDTVYNLSVARTITQVTQNAVASYAASTLKVNGQAATSGVDVIIPLNANGITTVTTVVTAESGVTKTYRVNISKPQPSNNADLKSLVFSTGTLTKISSTSYNLAVSSLTDKLLQKATTADANATFTVNGSIVSSGSDVEVILDSSTTVITTVVTAETGVQKTYIVTVNKPAMTSGGLVSKSNVNTERIINETTSITPHQALSPNGDGINDYFEIEGISNYADNQVIIINRNGAKVYEIKGYDNLSKRFDGHSNINGLMQPVGTYFYLIEYTKDSKRVRKTGYIAIKN